MYIPACSKERKDAQRLALSMESLQFGKLCTHLDFGQRAAPKNHTLLHGATMAPTTVIPTAKDHLDACIKLHSAVPNPPCPLFLIVWSGSLVS